ncbi:MAG: hypothetical protein COB02_16170 [Candidatus Cloacimonadota bacterium]|nr:MAG: hypothetical protein COB02_16170 [Candidatus Cloacimonadota bacterium]
MEKQHRNIIIFLLFTLFAGCGVKDQPFFDLNQAPVINTSNIIQFSILDEAMPNKLNSFVLQKDQIPNNSIYLNINQLSPNSRFVHLDVYVKNIIGIYDSPFSINYNPNIIKIIDSSDEVEIIEGPQESRLRKFLPSNSVVFIGKNDNNTQGLYHFSQSLLSNLGTAQNYNGLIVSIPLEILSPADFTTIIGFINARSSVLDKNGNPLDTQFFGGEISRKR